MPSRMKIDEKTMVPLGVVVCLFSVGIGITATGAFWVFQVDTRLTRIEKKLDLSKSGGILIPEAAAKEK